MYTPLVDEFTCENPFLVDEVDILLEQLGECIAEEVLIRVNQRLANEKTKSRLELFSYPPEYVTFQLILDSAPESHSESRSAERPA